MPLAFASFVEVLELGFAVLGHGMFGSAGQVPRQRSRRDLGGWELALELD